ncbi:MAG: hypothetical protein MUO54_09175, partial [Anaerolineales bacterium]|nr:hypothetical protein [Anaerolineales bacterium]
MKITTEQYEIILSNLPDAALIMFRENLDIVRIIDHDHILKEIIPGLSSIKNLNEISEPQWKSSIQESWRKAIQGNHDIRQFIGISDQVKIHMMSLPDVKGNLLGILMMQGNRDLRNEFKEKLKEDKEELKKEKEDAEVTSEQKSWFMAGLSHEIRTPLNAIIGFIEQLQKTDLSETQEEYLK